MLANLKSLLETGNVFPEAPWTMPWPPTDIAGGLQATDIDLSLGFRDRP